MEISTIELEKMFYQGPENLEKIYAVLAEDFKMIEDGDNTLISYVVDNLYQADKLLSERAGLYGIIERAAEIAEAALDYYEALYFEEIRQEDEKRVTEANKDITDAKKEVKRLTDTVIKARAAVKVGPYRRMRSLIVGYAKGAEKSLTSLNRHVTKCDNEAIRAHKATYRPNEKPEATPAPSCGDPDSCAG
jgi:hypothetical protein